MQLSQLLARVMEEDINQCLQLRSKGVVRSDKSSDDSGITPMTSLLKG